jgi:hypothetical protein
MVVIGKDDARRIWWALLVRIVVFFPFWVFFPIQPAWRRAA